MSLPDTVALPCFAEEDVQLVAMLVHAVESCSHHVLVLKNLTETKQQALHQELENAPVTPEECVGHCKN